MDVSVFIRGYKAKVTLAKAESSVRNLLGAIRMVFVSARYQWVKSGDVLVADGGIKLILAEHHKGLRHRGFLGFEVTQTLQAVETEIQVHPVTGMAGARVDKAPVTMDFAEYQAESEDELGFATGVHLYVTGTPMTRDWKLNGKRVSKVTPKLGVYFVEVED